MVRMRHPTRPATTLLLGLIAVGILLWGLHSFSRDKGAPLQQTDHNQPNTQEPPTDVALPRGAALERLKKAMAEVASTGPANLLRGSETHADLLILLL
jgi:hypothetical protein